MIIAMDYNDHEPPHFHARYGSQKGRFAIDEIRLLDGNLKPRVRGLIVEWASEHLEALRRNWERARVNLPLEAIAPLE